MYGSAAGFISYHENRGRTIPAHWTNSVIEAALLLASEWVDRRYGNLFEGFKTGGYTQEREWPRTAAYTNNFPIYVFADDEMPDAVAHAAYEAAFRECTTEGTLNVDFTPSKYKSVSVDGAVSVDYNDTISNSDLQIKIEVVDHLMQPLLKYDYIRGGLSGSSGRV